MYFYREWGMEPATLAGLPVLVGAHVPFYALCIRTIGDTPEVGEPSYTKPQLGVQTSRFGSQHQIKQLGSIALCHC